MDNNNKLPKPQEFELVELLFQEYIRPNIARPLLEYSFQARFQSFVNQIPSYLHSSSNLGFFTHFFFGSFATLLDIKLSEKIGIKKLHYNFDTIDTLRIVVEITDKTHIFIFIENSNKNNKKQTQNKQEELEFTTGEWQMLKGRAYNTADKNNLEISVIKVNKSKGNIKVTVEKQNIKDSADSTKQYHEVTRQLVDEKGKYIYLDGEIPKLSSSQADKQTDTLRFVLKYIKKIYDHYQILPYAAGAQEADQHGFVAGIFNNFRYRENAHVYLEQFAGKGYADIVLLVRGAGRSTTSIPIIIELKAGSGSGTTFGEALAQAIEYTKGFQPNNMRILSLSNNILCVGMNLDGGTSSFMQMQLVTRNQEIVPLAQYILDTVKQAKVSNHDTIKKEIYNQLENTYHTFPGTGEKSTAHYFSRFIIGEVLVLQDYDKHIFMYDQDEYIPTKTIIDQHATRSKDSHATKKQGIEKIVDISNAVTTTLLISKDQSDPAIILNIIDTNREVTAKNIPLDADLIGNRKIISLDIKFNIDKSSKEFKQYCDVKLEKVYNSVSEYNSANNEMVHGNFKKIDSAVSVELVARIKNAIDSQKGLIISENEYKELFKKIGEVIYPIKSLVNSEAEFQSLLEGTFKYYSDTKLAEGSESRALILTEFQTGAGGRIDMLVQAIGESVRGTEEYTPVGLELKYNDRVKLSSFEKKQDEYIQRIILRHKEQVLVRKLLTDQVERYTQGAAIKSITDSNKVAIMGLVFNKQAKDENSLLLTTERFSEANIVHSSKLYTTSVNIDVPSINDLPKPDSEGFIPDWVERDTLNLIAKAETDNDSSMWYLSNSLLDNQKMQELQNLLQKDKQLAQYIDGLDLSFNSVTASSVKELIKQLRRLVYLDLSDNDLANNNLLDLKEIIEDIQVPILKIADIRMNDEQMGKIFKSLAENDKISDLDITHLEDDNNLIMSQDTASKIGQYLKSTRMLNYLNIANNKIDDVAMSIIAQGLKGQSTLSSLVLTENSIGAQGAKALGEVLKDTTISNIDLSGNPLGILGVQAIVAGLRNADNIESIGLVNVALKYNRYDRDTSRRLLSSISSLFKNQHLTKINIAENNIGNGALSNIFKILSTRGGKSNLQDLSLAGNTIDWGAHQATINTLKSYMYDFISTSQKIRSLDLAFMSIDDDLGQAIAQALEKNVSLINLDFGGNDLIGSKTVQGLANVLKTHQYLKYLNLSDNKLSITDLRLILEAMRMNQVVSHINLSGNDFSGIMIDSDGKQIMDLDHQDIDFVNLLKGNKELKYLNLAKCQLSQKSLLSLFKAIENNISLEVLDIRANEIESSIIDNIVRSLKHNANQGLDIGLKVLHISKGVLERSVISKLIDKSLGISVLVNDDVLPNDSLEERLEQVCQIDPVDKKEPLAVDRESQTFERETMKGHYHYWLQAHDILDIARVYYGYDNRAIEIVGSISQLSREITQYLSNGNNSGAFTMILNIGESGAGGNHWVSLVLNRVGSSNYGYYIDSVGNSIAGNVVSILNQHGILIHDFNTRQQMDGYNCGLWALENSRRICEIVEANKYVSKEDIRNSLVRSRSEEEFEQIRDNILRELLNDNQRRVNLENMGLAQVEMPQDYNDNYELYRQSMASYEQCAMLAMLGSSFKVAKSKRSISEIEKKLSLDSQKFVDCAHAVKQDMLYSQLMLLVNHFQVVGDNKSCKAIDKLIKNQGIINRLKSINKTIPIEIINVKDSGYNWSLLHKAAQFGDVEEVEKLITQGIDVNIKARDGWSPLHLASQYASKEIVRLLISYNADTDISAKRYWTPLHLASQSISTEIIELLIKNGAYVDVQTDNGWAPLHIAVQFLNQEIVSALLKNKANINISNQVGWTALHLAVSNNNVGMVKLLMENNADIIIMSQDHNTPLHLAVKNDCKDIKKYLIGEFKGKNGDTLLHLAVKSNNKEIIELLIKNEASVNAVDENGDTPLHLAVAMNNQELVEYLIAHNANVNAIDKDSNTPLHLAVVVNNKKLAEYLIAHNANVNAIDKDGNIPLHLAVAMSNQELVEYLIAHNANVNAYNHNGESPISIGGKIAIGIGVTVGILFVIGGSVLIVGKGIGGLISSRGGYSALSGSVHASLDSLVESGANLNIQNRMGNTLLHESVQHNNYEMVELWLKRRANIDVANNLGNTPLHVATNNLRYRGRITRDVKNINVQHSTDDITTERIIYILVEHKANVSIKNKANDTPLHLAVKKSNQKIIELFLKEVSDGSILFSKPNNNGETILSLAFISGNSDIVSCFINFRDRTGENILHLAVKSNNKEIIELLIKNGASVNAVDENGDTPLHLAVAMNNQELVEYLIAHNANVNSIDKDGNTPLHLAVAMNNQELVEYLITHNANVNAIDKDGNTPLHLAVNLENKEIIKYLIQHGAGVIIKNNLGEFALQDVFVLNMFKNALDKNDNTMLHDAVKNHDENMVSLLLKTKVNLDIQNKDGNTALHLAATERNKKIFELLLQSKADVNIKNIDGKTPIELGIKNGIATYQLLNKYNILASSEYQELNHKHRHHHGESYNGGDAHHGDNKHISGNYRGRRAIEDKIKKIVNDNNDAAVSISDVDIFSKALYHDDNLLELNKDDVDSSKLLGQGYKVAQVSSKLIGKEESPMINGINDYLLDKQGNLLLLDLLIRKKNGVKYNSQKAMMESRELDPEYAQSLAYNAYVPYRAENEEDMELLGNK